MVKFKKVLSLLLVCVFFGITIGNSLNISAQTEISVSKENLDPVINENEIIAMDLDELSDDEFEQDSIVVILKQEYSSLSEKMYKRLFQGIESKEINNLMDSSNYKANEFRSIFSIKLKKSGRKEVSKAIEKLKKRKEILYAGPNLIMKMQGQFIPNDPVLNDTENMKPYHNMSLPDAWDITVGSKKVIVANNEPIDYTHEDLVDNMWNNPNPTMGDYYGYNFNSPTGDVYPYDGNGHGTITAGVIGAVGNNGKGASGVAQNVSIMSVMSAGSEQFSKVINYLNKHKVEIFNISLGWGTIEDPVIKQSFLNYNGLVTISAGNGSRSSTSVSLGFDIDNPPSDAKYYYPAAYAITCPNVIAVAAVDNNDNLQKYSNYGVKAVALAAPSQYQTTNLDNKYLCGSGTSCSAPTVAGTAALIKSISPDLSWNQVKKVILDNVDVLPNLVGKVGTGGRLNVYKAVNSLNIKKGTYYIRNLNSSLYLDVEAQGFENLIQHTFNGAENQKFRIDNYYVQSVINNKYINKGDLYSPGFYRGIVGTSTPIYFMKNADGTYCIVRKENNTWKALDVFNGSKVSGAVVGWFNYTGNNNQKWVLEEGSQAVIADGTYYIVNDNSGLMMDLKESTNELIQHGFNGGLNQQWVISRTSSGNYRLKTKSIVSPGYIGWNYLSGEYIGVIKESALDIGIYKNTDGTYRFMLPNYTFSLTVKNESQLSGTGIVWSPYNNQNNQQWILVPR